MNRFQIVGIDELREEFVAEVLSVQLHEAFIGEYEASEEYKEAFDRRYAEAVADAPDFEDEDEEWEYFGEIEDEIHSDMVANCPSWLAWVNHRIENLRRCYPESHFFYEDNTEMIRAIHRAVRMW